MNKLGLGYTIKARSVYKIDEDSPLVYGRDDEVMNLKIVMI